MIMTYKRKLELAYLEIEREARNEREINPIQFSEEDFL